MLPGFDKIVEERIKKARKQGAFKNLSTAGKPLDLERNTVPEELRIAYKILKNADFLPPEISLRKEIRQTEDLLEGMTDTVKKYKTLKKLNYLIMKLNMSNNASVQLDMPQHYADKIVTRIERKT